ncbi:hypothetical protein BG003_002584 [Podila horticola]|nr:hypothetical protein BG003_002584 [Podila horticola]
MKAYKKAGKGGVNQNNKRSAPSSTESRGKRMKKDQKFGFGGKKRHAKSNTADSSADVSGFSVKRNKSTSFKSGHKAAKGGAKGAKGGAKQRPGKSRRQSVTDSVEGGSNGGSAGETINELVAPDPTFN